MADFHRQYLTTSNKVHMATRDPVGFPTETGDDDTSPQVLALNYAAVETLTRFLPAGEAADALAKLTKPITPAFFCTPLQGQKPAAALSVFAVFGGQDTRPPALGHPQGMIPAVALAASDSESAFLANTLQVLTLLFHFGTQATLAFPPTSVPPRVTADFEEIGEGILSATAVDRVRDLVQDKALGVTFLAKDLPCPYMYARGRLGIATVFKPTTHFVDFGPSGASSVVDLIHGNKEGSGAQIILALVFNNVSGMLGRLALLDASRDMIPYALHWAKEHRPQLVEVGDVVHLDTKFTRQIGRPPVMVAGMTPTTVSAQIVSATLNAGYHAELAGGGHFTEAMLRDKVKDNMTQVVPGNAITINMKFMNPREWAFQYPLVQALRREGFPVGGIKHQWAGGRAGGHRLFENMHALLLEHYAAIRWRKNIELVAGSGLGGVQDTLPDLMGDWVQAYARPAMPFDAVLFGSRMLFAKEAQTSDAAKDLIVSCPGINDETGWENAYVKPTGGIPRGVTMYALHATTGTIKQLYKEQALAVAGPDAITHGMWTSALTRRWAKLYAAENQPQPHWVLHVHGATGLLYVMQFTQLALTLVEKAAFAGMEAHGLVPPDCPFVGLSVRCTLSGACCSRPDS
ncbi:beta subunit of fatty acid synthetase [Allomyces arbusculus]|nr:beta subunit of fatty acid synthetase [Allomyces arbusculus]